MGRVPWIIWEANVMTMVLISGRKVRIRKGHGVPEAAVRGLPWWSSG